MLTNTEIYNGLNLEDDWKAALVQYSKHNKQHLFLVPNDAQLGDVYVVHKRSVVVVGLDIEHVGSLPRVGTLLRRIDNRVIPAALRKITLTPQSRRYWLR